MIIITRIIREEQNELIVGKIERVVVVGGRRIEHLSVVVDDVVRAVDGPESLRDDENHVDEIADEHEAARAEFEHANGRVAQVEAIDAEHAQEDAQQNSGLVMVRGDIATR